LEYIQDWAKEFNKEPGLGLIEELRQNLVRQGKIILYLFVLILLIYLIGFRFPNPDKTPQLPAKVRYLILFKLLAFNLFILE
jgi:hypothetical protein